MISSSFTYAWTYDVFLSFRGEDTRTTFTGHLYNHLTQSGIHTFIDDRGLKRGEEITPSLHKAIEESRIAIIVFSKNYASSSFCLEELVKILEPECPRQLVWPVFYGVDPSELRHQHGNYGEALYKHQRMFKNDKKVQKWKQALQKVANLSGWHFKQGYDHEYQFIEKIVKEVSARLHRTPLHIANYPVGLESRLQEINSLLRVGSDDEVKIVGIYGIGGIGKTTIARAVYNLIADQFEGLCFLADVRHKSEHLGLVKLQETLLSELVREHDNIKWTDVNRGISILKWRLKNKKVLVIFDDVDKIEQLQALAGGCNWFGSGSIIIITTRDKHLLDFHRVEKVYEVKELNYLESLDLFCWNAFGSNGLDPCYQDISKSMIDYAKGLPLALEIIGSNLVGKTMKEWNSLLESYRRIPNARIGDVLKVSYDGLEEYQQEIFLDIACFFKCRSLEYVEVMVQRARGFNPAYDIRVLNEKSLIKIEEGCVGMHDLIQDMGREIVRKQSPVEPGKRSRLWSPEDIIHVLKEDTGTGEVEVIILDLPKKYVLDIDWKGKAFKKMKNLTILIIKNVHFSRGPEYLPNSLRVLEWWGYPSPNLPSDFRPNKLSVLDMKQNCLSSLKPIMEFKELSVLNLDSCKLITQIPDVSLLPNLTEISFKFCENLVEVHDSVGFLDKLRILRASWCVKLRNFPPLKLTNLEELDIDFCSSLRAFPEILGEMKKIRQIRILEIGYMEFPPSVKNLTGLQRLFLYKNKGVKLPISIAMLPKLNDISVRSEVLHFVPIEDEGSENGSMIMSSKLDRLVMERCNISDQSLSICLGWFANVKFLSLCYSNFTTLPACIKEYHFLERLLLNYCKHLQEIRELPPNIKSLSAQNCTMLSSQSNRILMSQELHDTGGKIFFLPGERIPEWFNHCTDEASITFWFRNKFPKVVLCAVIGLVDKKLFTVNFNLHVTINGNKRFCSESEVVTEIQSDHILVFDLQSLIFIDEGEQDRESCVTLYDNEQVASSSVKEWNHVVVSFVERNTSAPPAPSWVPIKEGVKESGIYVFCNERNNMGDIRFTNPYMDDEGKEICSSEAFLEAVVSSLDVSKLSKTGYNGSDEELQQQQQHSTSIHQFQFSLCTLISSIVTLCSSLTAR